jgi:Spy/CpxP family protein refolding chaperone
MAVAVALLAATPASAGLYCCEGKDGKRTCGDVMPPSCIGRQTTLKDERGTKVIEMPLTAEQRAKRAEEAEQKKAQEEALREQRRQDQALLTTYMSAKDIDVARARAEKEVEDQIKAATDKIATATARRKKYDGESEFYKNKPLPEEIRRGIKDTEFEIKAQTELVENKKKELKEVRAKFDADKKRYEDVVKARAMPR